MKRHYKLFFLGLMVLVAATGCKTRNRVEDTDSSSSYQSSNPMMSVDPAAASPNTAEEERRAICQAYIDEYTYVWDIYEEVKTDHENARDIVEEMDPLSLIGWYKKGSRLYTYADNLYLCSELGLKCDSIEKNETKFFDEMKTHFTWSDRGYAHVDGEDANCRSFLREIYDERVARANQDS